MIVIRLFHGEAASADFKSRFDKGLKYYNSFKTYNYMFTFTECRSELKALKENIRDSDDKYESLQQVCKTGHLYVM